MSKLNRLLPIKSPTARSAIPIRTALMSTVNSGSDVAPARRTLPTNSRPKPVKSAIASAYRVRNVPATMMTAAAPKNCRIAPDMNVSPRLPVVEEWRRTLERSIESRPAEPSTALGACSSSRRT